MSLFRTRVVGAFRIWSQIIVIVAILLTVASQFQNCAGAKFDQDLKGEAQGVTAPTEEIFKTIKPALAVRGGGCFTCHANINASFITDMGYGNTYYRANASIYSNFGMDQMLMTGGTMYVPKTTDDLSSYVRERNTFPVEVRDRIYIGAPSAQRLREALGATGLHYLPNDSSSPALSGIALAGTVYRGSGLITCDGDLLVDGHLYLKGATIRSIQGCRLYVTGAVFISGGLLSQSHDGGLDHNIQISSALSINLGLNVADVTERYVTNSRNSVAPTRAYPNTTTFGNLVLAAAAQFTDLENALSETGGRYKGFSRLLLNAPRIDSRYIGNFKGSIITELPMLSIANFAFEYDMVFTRVPILPRLKPSDYLDVN